jgi:hypothetical protein
VIAWVGGSVTAIVTTVVLVANLFAARPTHADVSTMIRESPAVVERVGRDEVAALAARQSETERTVAVLDERTRWIVDALERIAAHQGVRTLPAPLDVSEPTP